MYPTKHLTRLSFPKNRCWKCRIRESYLRQKKNRSRRIEARSVGFAPESNPKFQTASFTQHYRGQSPRYNVHRRGKRPSENGRSNFAETSAVIPAQAGIQKFEVTAVLKYFPNVEVWIPACAGMTALKNRQFVNRSFKQVIRFLSLNPKRLISKNRKGKKWDFLVNCVMIWSV